jgi:hypothetical protein
MATARRRARVVLGSLLVTAGLVVAPPLTGPASAVNVLVDGGFEQVTQTYTSPGWTGNDSYFATAPLCQTTSCAAAPASPRTGTGWAWFGGRPEANHTSFITTTVAFPSGATDLTFWMNQIDVGTPFTATLKVLIDGTIVQTYTEQQLEEGQWLQKSIPVAAYANGIHVIRFEYANVAAGDTDWYVDDVVLDDGTLPVTATPTVDTVSPSSPGVSTTPRFSGTAEAGSVVSLYTTSDCSGPAAAVGPAQDYVDDGLPVDVAKGSTTTVYARATKPSQLDSACSPGLTYTQQDPPLPPVATPDTTFTRTPAKKVFTSKSRKKVTFAFTSTLPGSTFLCRVDGKAAKACSTPFTFKAGLGKHTVTVSATRAGRTDPTPATYTFKVKRKRSA